MHVLHRYIMNSIIGKSIFLYIGDVQANTELQNVLKPGYWKVLFTPKWFEPGSWNFDRFPHPKIAFWIHNKFWAALCCIVTFNSAVLLGMKRLRSDLRSKMPNVQVFDRPSVARAVLLTTSSLTESSFVKISSIHLQSQTVRARMMRFWDKGTSPPTVMWHVSYVACQMYFFGIKVMKLVVESLIAAVSTPSGSN